MNESKNTNTVQYPIYTKTKRGYIEYSKHVSECECVTVVPEKMSITVESYPNSAKATVAIEKLGMGASVRCTSEEFDTAMSLTLTKIEAL